MFKVSVNFTVRMVIENVLRGKGGDSKDWVVSEVFEHGCGGWYKVSIEILTQRDMLTSIYRVPRWPTLVTERRARWVAWDGVRREACNFRLSGLWFTKLA
jgi:hypothetical protein